MRITSANACTPDADHLAPTDLAQLRRIAGLAQGMPDFDGPVTHSLTDTAVFAAYEKVLAERSASLASFEPIAVARAARSRIQCSKASRSAPRRRVGCDNKCQQRDAITCERLITWRSGGLARAARDACLRPDSARFPAPEHAVPRGGQCWRPPEYARVCGCRTLHHVARGAGPCFGSSGLLLLGSCDVHDRAHRDARRIAAASDVPRERYRRDQVGEVTALGAATSRVRGSVDVGVSAH